MPQLEKEASAVIPLPQSSGEKTPERKGPPPGVIPTFAKMDKAAFFALIQTQPEQYRFEFVRGRIMQQMAGGTLRHVRIASRFIDVLGRRLDSERWLVLPSSDRAIDCGDSVRYADVVVEPSGGDPKSLATEVPAIVVEVLSPSSVDRDLFVKPAEYLSISSLHAYVVASQDEPLCFLWLRDSAGQFPADGTELRGGSAHIDIPMLSHPIPLEEIYRGLLPEPGPSN